MRRKTPPVAIRSLACAVIVALSLLAFERNRVWRSDETLWKDTIAVSPGSWKSYVNLGAHYFDTGQHEKAFRFLERLAEQRQNDGLLRLFRAQYAHQQGDHTEVIELLEDKRPKTLGEAKVLSGMTPAAVTNLQVYLAVRARNKKAAKTRRES